MLSADFGVYDKLSIFNIFLLYCIWKGRAPWSCMYDFTSTGRDLSRVTAYSWWAVSRPPSMRWTRWQFYSDRTEGVSVKFSQIVVVRCHENCSVMYMYTYNSWWVLWSQNWPLLINVLYVCKQIVTDTMPELVTVLTCYLYSLRLRHLNLLLAG